MEDRVKVSVSGVSSSNYSMKWYNVDGIYYNSVLGDIYFNLTITNEISVLPKGPKTGDWVMQLFLEY